MKVLLSLLVVVLFSTSTFAGESWGKGYNRNRGLVYQFGPVDFFFKGLYDGFKEISEVKRYGNLGLGTFHGVDGEMVVVDGVFYQIDEFGVAREASDSDLIPFVTLIKFHPDYSIELGENSVYADAKATLNDNLPSQHLIYAFRVTGQFKRVLARSAPAQTKPYIPITDPSSIENQAEHEFENIRGTMVGYLFPDHMSRLNIANYHLHFISENKTQGGHVLDFQVDEATIEVDVAEGFQMIYSKSPIFRNFEPLFIEESN